MKSFREPRRKDWCPGALRPMVAGDGLLVRVKPTGGILSAVTARALADLARQHGNGHIDLSTRANLQIRGVRASGLPALVSTLGDLGLVDADADAEAVRNVVASPLAGLHDGLDIRPLVAALEARLVGTRALRALPGKFGFLIDDGSALSLSTEPADVRFDWRDGLFEIGVGGARTEALAIGRCRPAELVDCAEAIARAALLLLARVPAARRLRDVVAVSGADVVAAACAPRVMNVMDTDHAVAPPVGAASTAIVALAVPYGRLDATMLALAADLAGSGEVRLTPWRSLLLPDAVASARERARIAGFLVDADDPRRAVAACVGAPECARATTTTRADADALADLAINAGDRAPRLHVSGCHKGCALSVAAPLTLVGREGRYDLVVEGRASDAPRLRGLDLATARAALVALQCG